MSQIVTQTLAAWTPRVDTAAARTLAAELEAGRALYYPHLDFAVEAAERRFLDPRWSDGRAKNISYDGARDQIKGAAGNESDLAALRGMIARFRAQAIGLVNGLFPAYRDALRIGLTSFRPMPVAGRTGSWRKDDARLHIDAFPSRPNQGERILRVFSNVNPNGISRDWRIGEPFPALVERFLPRLRAPLPGSAALLRALRLTKSRRSDYDHYMLGLHDAMKADLDYQRNGFQQAVPFAAGSTWVCYSDQLAHAVSGGQFLLEQTLHLAPVRQYDPEAAPLRVLERALGRPLAP